MRTGIDLIVFSLDWSVYTPFEDLALRSGMYIYMITYLRDTHLHGYIGHK